MRWRFEYRGIEFLVRDKQTWMGNMPNVQVRISGEVCLMMEAFRAYDVALALVEYLGGRVDKNKVGRVDLCLDMPDVPVREFAEAFLSGAYVTRATSKGWDESNGITVRLGSSPLKVRIYDKRAELLAKDKCDRIYAMEKYRWGDRIPEHATRVEFEVRREALKSRGIDTVEDYRAKRGDLAGYLVKSWIRFMDKPVDRANRNQNRARVSALWRVVQDGFEKAYGAPTGQSLEPLEKGEVNVRQLWRQVYGLVVKASGQQGVSLNDHAAMLQYMDKGLLSILR
jgi:hypothetical protein